MRRKKQHEPENHERWLVSYADFITLLFAFFVVLYATSTQNAEKEKKFEESIREELKLPSSSGPLPGSGAGGLSQQAGGGRQIIASAAGDPDEKVVAQQGQLVRSGELQERIERKIASSMSSGEQTAIGPLRHDAIGVRMTLAASSFFPSGSAKIKRSALSTLDKVADLVKPNDYRVLIEGHTDDLPLPQDSNFESNWELASARATAVVRYFAKVHRVNPKRLAALSYADQRPLVPNVSEQNRAQNRRIEILILTGDNPYEEF